MMEDKTGSVSQSRILVAASTPQAGEKLAGVMENLAGRLNASVLVAHVAQSTDDDESSDDTRHRASLTLSAMQDRLEAAGIAVEGMTVFSDDVAKAILNAAEDQKATLIVLGISGKGTVARWLAGDVPQKIIKGTAVPVLLCPPDWQGVI